jgi:protein phosphatase 1 regulatory subunit 7
MYSDQILSQIDSLCSRHGNQIEVRFYGHYDGAFDCSTLRRLPSVTSLSVDCLRRALHLDEIANLPRLERLALDVFELEHPALLAKPALQRLKALRIGDSRRPMDLSAVSDMRHLVELNISGQALHIGAIGTLVGLRDLTLRSIPKSVDLTFVNGLRSLTDLSLLLGGREDIAELDLPGLLNLEVVRVRGLAKLELARFPNLTNFLVEDQIRLEALDFGQLRSLSTAWLINCKNLASVSGLEQLPALRHLRIARTAVDLEQLLDRALPATLQVVGLYSGKAKQDRALRERLEKLGYREFDHPT